MRQEEAGTILKFSVKEEGEHPIASMWRWDDCQRQMKSQEEQAWKENQGLEEEDKRKWCAADEDTARKMLKYLQDNEDLKVGLCELKEQLETPEEAGEVHIASLAREDTQLKGMVSWTGAVRN